VTTDSPTRRSERRPRPAEENPCLRFVAQRRDAPKDPIPQASVSQRFPWPRPERIPQARSASSAAAAGPLPSPRRRR
jgi:hypothetical protein